MSPNLKWFIIFLVVIGAVLRFYYLAYPLGKSSEITVDEAVYGLQAIKIQNGDRPIFYPAQDYTGSFSAYLSALVFSFVGVSSFSLKVIPFLFSIGTIVLIYLLAKRIFGLKVSVYTLFICALGTPFWNNWSSRAGTGYVEATFLGVLILLLVLRATEAPASNKSKAIYFFLLGLLSGVGFWVQPTIIYFVLSSLIYFLLVLRKNFLVFLPFFTIGFLIGAAPVVYYNLAVRPSATASALFKKPWGVRTALIKIAVEGFPVLVGGRSSNSRIDFNPVTSNFVYLLFILSLAYFTRLTDRLKKTNPQVALIFLTLILTVGIFLISTPFNQFSIEPRYVFALYAVLPIIFGVFLDKIGRFSRPLLIFVLVVYTANFFFGLVQAGPLTFLDSYRFEPLVSFLREHKINYAVASPTLGHRAAFFSKGTVMTAVRGGGITEVRFEKENQTVGKIRDNDPRLVVYISREGDSQIESFRQEAESQLGDYFSEFELGQKFIIFYSNK